MNYDLSYTIFELADNGFRFNETIGFLNSVNKSSRFEMFQTPIYLSPLEKESLGSVRFAKSSNFNIISIVGYIGQKPSKGNRNCYKGIGFCIKINNSIPNIITLVNQFINIFESFNNSHLLPSSLETSIKYKESLKIDKIKSRTKIAYEIFTEKTEWTSILINILDSLNGRNRLFKQIFFSQKTLANSAYIDQYEIDVRNNSQEFNNIVSEFISQIENKYLLTINKFDEIENGHLKRISELKLRKIDLNKHINELSNILETKENRNKELAIIINSLEINIETLNIRKQKIISQITNRIRVYRFLTKNISLIVLIMLIIAIVRILAITIDKK